MLHRTRALLIRQPTMLANAFRAHLAEVRVVVAPRHQAGGACLIEKVFSDARIPLISPCLGAQRTSAFRRAELLGLSLQIKTVERNSLPASDQVQKAGDWKRSRSGDKYLDIINPLGKG